MAIQEWKMLFDKINNGSPFGVIGAAVVRFDNNLYPPQLGQLLEYKRHTAICYCENKQDTQNTDTKEIKFLSAKSHDFGKELDSISVELSNPNTFIQSFLKLGSFLHGKTIEFLDNPKNYPPVNLSNAIVGIINQAENTKENTNRINLTSAIIDKIEYHFRDNTFHFIFNVSNNFLSGKSRLTIEVPRMALENIKLPDMKEICVNQWYINIFINILRSSINEGSYIYY
ncbi:hypothetical protein [Helicobacter pylori]|uniref:hypothetical protein n=1 Tax=Helicobacter pylori TaxID=210 RepID=UPI000D3897DB|nr:hypothetical protein [Helicobacter pylori]PUD38582.1 hypothetical protein C2R88_00440 [Helicobacter pylori]